MKLRTKPIVLLILDGFGIGTNSDDNAIFQAKMPHWQTLLKNYAHGAIDASGHAVGLPEGQFGNSEVGHITLGAGRLLNQDINRINEAIQEGSLPLNPMVKKLAEDKKRRIHLLGLLSDGGVHSHIDHFFAFMKVLWDQGCHDLIVHPILDGRDTPPKSAKAYLERLQDFIAHHSGIKVGTVGGRFYAMDRDKRWDRVEKAYNTLLGIGPVPHYKNALAALKASYEREESDEFVFPSIINDEGVLREGDAFVFMNYRADRARELMSALIDKDFNGFTREKVVKLSLALSMTDYGEAFNCPMFFPPATLNNTLGAYLASLRLKQLRIAETEKYPHVTYFFSGGVEQKYPGEKRILIPSPKVKTYDLQPEMSALEVTEALLKELKTGDYALVICNFANGDMVGHTGNLSAAIRAVETLDKCIGKITKATREQGGEVIITADHGNCEIMYDPVHQQPHTQHTTNLVPFVYVGEKARIVKGGTLRDVAPSILHLLGLKQPKEMNGHNLIDLLEDQR